MRLFCGTALTVLGGIVLGCLVLGGAAVARAEDFRDACDSEQTSWTAVSGATERLHVRNTEIYQEGSASEQIVVESERVRDELVLIQKLPKPGRVIPELKATVWMKSNRPGARLYLRIIFPNQKHPQTGQVLSTVIEGGGYGQTHRWQQLTCETSDKAMQNEIRLIRARLKPEDVDVSGSYVDQVLVRCPLVAGTTEVFLDDVRVGPLAVGQQKAAEEQPVVRPAAEVRMGQLEVNGQPRLTIMVVDHGEEPEFFKDLHANTVLVPSVNDRARLSALREREIRVAAVPPEEARTDPALAAQGMAEYGWPEISIWYLGTLVESRERERFAALMEQLRRHDFRLRRPALIDVIEDERYFSRYAQILGTSRHNLGTSFPPEALRKWLTERSRLANPGTNLFYWVQIEFAPPVIDWRKSAGRKLPVVEPEQIRQQVYAAINAGFRGFGYFNRSSLEGDAPGALECRLTLKQLNLELELIEPLLASANLADIESIKIDDRTRKLTRKDLDFQRNDADRELEIKQKLAERNIRLRNQRLTPNEAEASIFQGSNYRLVVAAWLGHDAQCVPGTLAANDAKVLIPEPSENAHFWELTTTGLKPLKKEKTAGYYQVTLAKFDQTAIILVSSDPGWRDQVEERARLLAPTSARVSIDLAKTKLERVRKTDAELHAIGHGQPDSPAILFRVAQSIANAEGAFSQQNYNQAREDAADAMQLMRSLQYAYWNEAVIQSVTVLGNGPDATNPSKAAKRARQQATTSGTRPGKPVPLGPIIATSISSPYTICFQTLPDHWQLVSRIGRSADRPQENLLSSGNFEGVDPGAAGWTQSQNVIDGISATAELCSAAHQGRYSLRLVAVPGLKVDPPVVIPKPPVTVSSPAVEIQAGQVLYISGWIKLATPVVGSLDGVTLHDNLGGTLGTLRFTEKGNWQPFQMLRDVRENGSLTLTINLNGMGEVLIDDLRIIPHTDRSIRAVGGLEPENSHSSKP